MADIFAGEILSTRRDEGPGLFTPYDQAFHAFTDAVTFLGHVLRLFFNDGRLRPIVRFLLRVTGLEFLKPGV